MGELRSYVGQEGDNQESSISKKPLPPPGLEGWGEDGVTRVQKPRIENHNGEVALC